MPEVYVGSVSEFDDGDRRVVTHKGLEIGVFRHKGKFVAYENYCAHQGGPVCQGRIFQRVEEVFAPDRTSLGFKFAEGHAHIVCPWHGYEYDLETGRFPTNPSLRLRKFEVTVRDGEVYITV